MNCARVGMPLPPSIRTLRTQATPYVNANDPTWIMTGAFIEAMDLWGAVDPYDKNPRLMAKEAEDYLTQAVSIDSDLKTRFKCLENSLEWRVKVITDPTASAESVYHGVYHEYGSLFIAKAWNGMRACRILTCIIIMTILRRDGLLATGKYDDLLQRARDTPPLMRDGILASAPQLLGYVQNSKLSPPNSVDSNTPVILGAYLYSHLWCLYLAGLLPGNPPEIRSWVANRLRAIRSLTGCTLAEYIANMLESGTESGLGHLFLS